MDFPPPASGKVSDCGAGKDVNAKDVDVNNLPEGWTKTENNGFVYIKNGSGKTRIRLDPPDSKTPFAHKHLYDKSGNSLDANGNIVNRTSPMPIFHITNNKGR